MLINLSILLPNDNGNIVVKVNIAITTPSLYFIKFVWKKIVFTTAVGLKKQNLCQLIRVRISSLLTHSLSALNRV